MAIKELAPLTPDPITQTQQEQELSNKRVGAEKSLRSILLWKEITPQAKEMYKKLKKTTKKRFWFFPKGEVRLAKKYYKNAKRYERRGIKKRDKLIRKQISPLKEFLGLDPFDPVQDKIVITGIKNFAKETGMPVVKTVTRAKELMDRAVQIQVRRRSSGRPVRLFTQNEYWRKAFRPTSPVKGAA